MEGLQKFLGSISKNGSSTSGSSSSSLSENPYNFNGSARGGEGLSTALSSSDGSRVFISRAPRQVVSLCTCSKLCMIFFVAGVVVGYTLKQRVRRWASKLLKKLRDD